MQHDILILKCLRTLKEVCEELASHFSHPTTQADTYTSELIQAVSG
jgi:hypothetical protein